MLEITTRDHLLREQRRLHEEALDKICTKPKGVNTTQFILDASFEEVLSGRIAKLRREYASGATNPSVSVVIAHDAVNEAAQQHGLQRVAIDNDVRELVGKYANLNHFEIHSIAIRFPGGRNGLTIEGHSYTRFILKLK